MRPGHVRHDQTTFDSAMPRSPWPGHVRRQLIDVCRPRLMPTDVTPGDVTRLTSASDRRYPYATADARKPRLSHLVDVRPDRCRMADTHQGRDETRAGVDAHMP
ncbi:hypothetical protein H5410_026148 [Solanum commersonii]|uniref:Uncharacterized protein n=1 Tax=Solanum commersonii TaxID=4109 RepID=A0A9J5YXX5_SOLCO|nr:hypothetical protein H5410_026148 [Solanum commersonii]